MGTWRVAAKPVQVGLTRFAGRANYSREPLSTQTGPAVLTLCLFTTGHSLQVAIRTMGNSRGVLIPKPILEQTGLVDAADLQVVNGVIEIRPLRSNPREGWAADSQRVAQSNDDVLVWPEFANAGDAELKW